MTTATHSQPTAPTECWCCGDTFTEAELVRLGSHPEVGLCLDCARWVKRRAVARRQEHHPSLAGRLHRGTDALRNHVIERGWHERGVLGRILRRIDRFLP